jgi:hypothetical protein
MNCGAPLLETDDWFWYDLHPEERAPEKAGAKFTGQLRGVSWEPGAADVAPTAKREHRECWPVVVIPAHNRTARAEVVRAA